MCVCVSRSVVSDSVTPQTLAHQASLSMGFPRQEYWSGLPFPSPLNVQQFVYSLTTFTLLHEFISDWLELKEA